LGTRQAGYELGECPKKFATRTSAYIEANNFKLGTQLAFGDKLVKTTPKTQVGDVLRRTPKMLEPL